jgi:beta-lactam-binding protein with PASTA domain
MNSFNPEYIKMPDLVNTSLRQAKSTMESCGLQLGRLHYKPDLAENYVLMQYYKGKRLSAGAKIPKGSKIDLIVGLGSGEGLQTSIPNVTGMTYNEAVSAISSAKLNVGAKVFAPEILTFADSVDAQVWKQDPLPEEKLQPGSLVDIWLKKKTESESNTNNELNEFENE